MKLKVGMKIKSINIDGIRVSDAIITSLDGTSDSAQYFTAHSKSAEELRKGHGGNDNRYKFGYWHFNFYHKDETTDGENKLEILEMSKIRSIPIERS